jgi:hypothetical protein
MAKGGADRWHGALRLHNPHRAEMLVRIRSVYVVSVSIALHRVSNIHGSVSRGRWRWQDNNT